MANPEQLALLKHDVAQWNAWRKETTTGPICLTGADLSGINLRRADLFLADLSRANLSRADLFKANLIGSDLRQTDLSGAQLNLADISQADLSGAHLCQATLHGSYFIQADFSQANFDRADFGSTIITQCETLHLAKNLETICHWGPSVLDHLTLRTCITHLPDVFLQGVGYTQEEIETLRALYNRGVQYYSCFLSYARRNSDFVNRLHADLLANGVSCWQDVHDMCGGDFLRSQINKAIRMRDKLLVVCSEVSLQRPEVVEEILEVIEEERKTKTQKLFPIAIDRYVLDAEVDEVMSALPPRQQREDWLTYLRDYHIPDFSGWKEHDAYTNAFNKLLRDLKNPGER